MYTHRKDKKNKAEQLDDNGIRLGLLWGFIDMFIETMGFCDCENQTVQSSPWMQSITIRFQVMDIGSNELKIMSDLYPMFGGEPKDGHPSVDIDIRAQDSEEDYKERYSFLKRSEPAEWKEVLKYKYKGHFDVELEFRFTREDWKKLGGGIPRELKELDKTLGNGKS
jgi:hypothetical protein